jgi:hypothetical protein
VNAKNALPEKIERLNRQNTGWNRVSLAVFIGIVFAFSLATAKNSLAQDSDLDQGAMSLMEEARDAEPIVRAAKHPIVTTIKSLADECDENSVRAEHRLGEKVVQLTGVVADISNTFGPEIDLEDRNEGLVFHPRIECDFAISDASEHTVEKVEKDETLTVRAKFASCSLVRLTGCMNVTPHR